MRIASPQPKRSTGAVNTELVAPGMVKQKPVFGSHFCQE